MFKSFDTTQEEVKESANPLFGRQTESESADTICSLGYIFKPKEDKVADETLNIHSLRGDPRFKNSTCEMIRVADHMKQKRIDGQSHKLKNYESEASKEFLKKRDQYAHLQKLEALKQTGKIRFPQEYYLSQHEIPF